jgi:hypothetical protein
MPVLNYSGQCCSFCGNPTEKFIRSKKPMCLECRHLEMIARGQIAREIKEERLRILDTNLSNNARERLSKEIQ